MNNVNYEKLTKQTYLNEKQLDIILAPYKEDIEKGVDGGYTLIYGYEEATRKDIDYLDVKDYEDELVKTLLRKQDGNPCFLCHNRYCEQLSPDDWCFNRQETEEDLGRLTDDELEEVVKATRY